MVWGGVMSSEADFIVLAVAGDAEQQNSIAISQLIQTAAQQYFCNYSLRLRWAS